MRRSPAFAFVLAGVTGAGASLGAWVLVAHVAQTTMLLSMAAALLALVVVTPAAAFALAGRVANARVIALSFVVALAVAPSACCAMPPWARRAFPPAWGFQRAFDRAEWLAQAGSGDAYSTRGEMVADLTRPGLVLGRTRAEVRELLGEPSGDRAGADEWIIGMWSGFGMDADGMVVVYDDDDVAVRIFTAQH